MGGIRHIQKSQKGHKIKMSIVNYHRYICVLPFENHGSMESCAKLLKWMLGYSN
jgi:hypothetical protein